MLFRAIRAVSQHALVLAAAIVINFVVPRLAPGDAIDYLLPPEQAGSITAAQRGELMRQFGLDGGIMKQFFRYLVGLAHFDFGVSIRYGQPVRALLLARLPWTVALLGSAVLIATVVGTFLGFRSGWRRGSTGDAATMASVLFLDSLPPFFVGMLLIIVFSIGLKWFPVLAGIRPRGLHGWSVFTNAARRTVLPLTTLVIANVGPVYLSSRAAMVSELSEDYVRMAEAKGLDPRGVRRHARRNALAPAATVTLVALGTLVGGATVVETVFSYPGLGRLTYDAVLARDYPVLQGTFLLLAIGVVLANFIADLAYPVLDPRARRGSLDRGSLRRTPGAV